MADASTISVLIRARDMASDAFKKVEANAGSMASGIAKHRRSIGIAMTAMGTAMTGFAVVSVKAASDLEESMNAVNVIFGDGAKVIHEFGENSARSVGLSTAKFNELASVTGALLKDVGLPMEEVAGLTNDLAIRAADMASVMNTSVEDALSAVGQALRGETEAIRRYAGDVTDASLQVFALSEGIQKQVSEMTEQEKRLLRVSLIMQQTNTMAGDFANTSESLANRMRIAKAEFANTSAELGTALLPLVTALMEKVQGVIKVVAEWIKEHPTLTKWITILAAGLGAVMLVLGPILLILPGLVTAIGLVSAAFVTLNLAMGPIGLTLTGITMAIIAGIAIWKNWDKIIEVLREAIGNFASKVIGFIITLGDGLTALAKWIPGMGGVADAISGTMETLHDAQKTIDHWADNSNKRVEEMGNAWGAMEDGHSSVAGAMKTNNETISTSTTQLANVIDTKTKEMVHGWGAVEDATMELAIKHQEALDEQVAAQANFDALMKLSRDSSRSAFQKELDDFMERKRRQGDVYDGMLDDASVYYDMVAQKAKESADKVIAETHRATADAPHIGQGMRATAMAPYAGGPVLPVGSSFDHSGWNKFSAEQQEKARMNWSGMSDKQLQEISGSSQEAVRWAASQEYFKRGTAQSSFRPGNMLTSDHSDWSKFEAAQLAAGGIVRRPTLGLVGEAGPEAVIPLNRAGGMGTNNFHFHGAVYGVEDLKEAVVEAVRDHAISGGFSGVFAEA